MLRKLLHPQKNLYLVNSLSSALSQLSPIRLSEEFVISLVQSHHSKTLTPWVDQCYSSML